MRVSARSKRPGRYDLWRHLARRGPLRKDALASSYWEATRRPLPSLLLVAPIVLAYESGIHFLGGRGLTIERTGADVWMRQLFASIGLKDPWSLPLLLLSILLAWQVAGFHRWRVSPSLLAGMALESIVWAVGLVGISRLIDVGFCYLERSAAVLAAGAGTGAGAGASGVSLAAMIGYLGAGVYEETLFRLVLVPCLFWVLKALQAPQVLASTLAVTGSALLFALAHHAGAPGETFTWFAFVFRWMAGVVFAWLFVLRGFGIAVGSHTTYDIVVSWLA
jgi:Type II CAAX prenyl endopeptidase Rce1-like